MTAPGWLLLAAAFCLGVLILTAIIVLLALRRGTQTLSRQLKENDQPLPQLDEPASANTRWARADLKANPQPPRSEIQLIPCPACGGENPAGSNACSFCGRKL